VPIYATTADRILNNYQIFAAAQKKHVYFYDHKGTETHRLKSHTDVNRLEFLPYHWLLVSIVRLRFPTRGIVASAEKSTLSVCCCSITQSQAGWLKYQDTSTGELVYEHSTKLGNCDCMVQNPWNAVINLGHYNGKIPCLARVASFIANARGISIGQARSPCGVQT
jgi:U3 small nucleolar RNA-associated protein 7